jgi:hypothetical protein
MININFKCISKHDLLDLRIKVDMSQKGIEPNQIPKEPH